MIQAIQDLLSQGGRAIIPEVGCLSINDEGKTVFNSFLTFNDGKLIGWLVQNEGLDENAATKKVESWASEIKAEVLSGKEFSLGLIGKFVLEGKDEIEFTTDLTSISQKTQTEVISTQTPIKEDVSETSMIQVIEPEPQVLEETIEKTTEETPKSITPLTIIEETDFREKDEVEEPSIEPTQDTPMSKSLDDILNKTHVQGEYPTEDESLEETDSDKNDEVEQLQEIERPKQVNESTENKAEELSEHSTESVLIEEVKPEEKESEAIAEKKEKKKSKKEQTEKAQSEEVTVKRKRGVFFYINIVLAVLILGIGAFALIYTDEVSAWLGISSQKTENIKDSIPEQNEIEAGSVFENPEEIEVEELVPVGEEINEAPEPIVNQPKVEEKPKPARTPEPVNVPAVASNGHFHIIVGKFAVKQNADRLVQKIINAGYDGKILRSTETGHTVSFHSYPTMEEAKNNINKAKEITGTGAYIEEKK